ncbi:hypothetical protein [Algiphilus aromaticivorans]|uniref:hypothetical protein n=1 Tax=Algiphilus aromaticivorans TaxID=382454 RepID=UPI0005C19E8B|nr:hypothetical protein [Algiphilus aromaticivorans]
MNNTPPIPAAAQRALDAHVSWLLARSEGQALEAWLDDTVDDALAHAETLQLGEVVSCEQVSETALRYAADLPMTGGIPDLVGEVARALLAMPELSEARLADLLPDRAMRSMIGKAAELHELRGAIIRELQASAAFRQFLTEVLHQGLNGLLRSTPMAERLGLQSVLDRVVAPRLDSVAAQLTRASSSLIAAVDDEAMEEALDQLWGAVSELPLAPLQERLSAEDIDDFAALAYAFWQEERGRALYRELIRRAIEAIFARYGDTTLAALLADLGVSRDMMLTEARQYAGPVLAVLRSRGILEQIIRKQLEPFYRSPELAAALAPQSSD